MLPKTADVVIIGGGVMGASIAYHLAERGLKNILVLEREKFLSQGSTGKAAGGVRYQFSTPVNIQLSLYSMNIIQHFAEIFGASCDYRPIGYLFLLTRADDLPQFRASLDLQHQLGVSWSRWMEPDEIRALVPLVHSDDVLGGTFCPKDGMADPSQMNAGFAKAATRLGAQIEMETSVTGIELDEEQRIVAVETNKGRVATPRVVDAAGAWAAQIGAMVGVEIPIVPLRRQLLVTAPLPEFPRDHPFTIEFASNFYFHPEGAGILFGMSKPDETPGYKFTIDEAFRLKTIEHGVERLPLLQKANISHEWAGLYEVTPDAHPILSKAREVEGFYIAAGFSGHGVMHSPATGKVMSEIILDGAAKTIDVSMLDLERFRENRLIREVNVI